MTPLPSAAYVAGKLLVSYIVTVPAIAAVLLAGIALNHVELTAAAWIELLVVLAIASLPFAALGLLIGYLFDANSAQGAMMICFFSLAIVGGLWAPLSSFPRPSLPSDACCRRSASPSWAGPPLRALTPDGVGIAVIAALGASPSVASPRGDTDPPNSTPMADDATHRSARRPGRRGLGVVRVRCS